MKALRKYLIDTEIGGPISFLTCMGLNFVIRVQSATFYTAMDLNLYVYNYYYIGGRLWGWCPEE